MSAEQTTTPDVPNMPSDAELFRSAMTPEPAPAETKPEAPAPDKTAQPQPEAGEPMRDERGRFASPQPTEPVKPAAPPAEDQIPPSHRWKEMREELEAERKARREMEFALYDQQQRQRAMQEQLAKAQPQKPEQIPDIISDPQAYHAYVENKFNSNLRTMEQNFSFRLAHQQHGDTFEQAYGEMISRAERGDPSVARAVMQSPDPGQAMMNWYRQATNLARLGNQDPETWASKVWLSEKLKDPKFQGQLLEQIRGSVNAQPQAQGGGPVDLPPSLNRLAAAAPVTAANGDMSDSSLFDFAFRQGRPPR